MDPKTLRDLYDAELRCDAEVADAQEVARIGPLYLATFPARGRGFVTYRSLVEGDDNPGQNPESPETERLVERVDVLIDTAVAHYVARPEVTRFEWKTRGHDAPADLVDRLLAKGFVMEEQETVMAGPVEAVIAAAAELPPGYSVHRAADEQEIRAAEALAGRVFGDSPQASSAIADELVERMREAPESFEMWFVRAPSGEIVCSGRVDPVPGTAFAGLWGGACLADHRGRGLYRALTAARARSVQARGVRYLQSDCTAYSRPILERAGLMAITTTTPAIWKRWPGAGASSDLRAMRWRLAPLVVVGRELPR